MITGPSDRATTALPVPPVPPVPPAPGNLGRGGLPSGSFLTGAGLVGAIAGASVAVSLPALCPFRLCTGHACPGCGLSRSVFSLVKGDLAASWRYHPLLIPLVVQVVIVALLRRVGLSAFWFNVILAANLVLIVGVWALRWRLGQLDLVVGR